MVIAAVVQSERGRRSRFLVDRLGGAGSGRVSYGVYLYHWPGVRRLDEERLGLDGHAAFTVRIVVDVVIVASSY